MVHVIIALYVPKTNKKPAESAGLFVFDLAAELGLEPRQYESES